MNNVRWFLSNSCFNWTSDWVEFELDIVLYGEVVFPKKIDISAHDEKILYFHLSNFKQKLFAHLNKTCFIVSLVEMNLNGVLSSFDFLNHVSFYFRLYWFICCSAVNFTYLTKLINLLEKLNLPSILSLFIL